jgi:hypothetical protein
MSNRLRKVIAAAVTLVATTAVSYGQTRLNADIGFPFKMQSANLPAGNYDLSKVSTGGSIVFQLRSQQEHQNVLILARYVVGHQSGDVQPRLVFRCNSSYCALAEIWTADGYGYAAPRPKLSPAEKERLAVVPLSSTKAD